MFSKPKQGEDLFFVPCPKSLLVSDYVSPAVSEWKNGEYTGAATKNLVQGVASSFLAGAEYGVTGNVPCLLHTIRDFNSAISGLSLESFDKVQFDGMNPVISAFTKSLASAWRVAAGVRRSVSPPRIFQAVLRNRLVLYGPPPPTLEQRFEVATAALKLNVDAVLLSDLHRALVFVARQRSVAVTAAFVDSILPELHQVIGKRDLLKSGIGKVSVKQFSKPKSIQALTPFYLKVREAVAAWEAISSLVGITEVLARSNAGFVCGKVSLPDSLKWSLYMSSILGSTKVHRLRLDSSRIEGEIRRKISEGTLSLMDGSVHFASLSSRLDRALELTEENGGIALAEGSSLSLCFRDFVTAKGALKMCQQMFKSPFSLGDSIAGDQLVPSASLPTLELGSCDVFGGLYGDNVTAVIIETRAVPLASNVTPVLEERSSGMDLLTEPAGVETVSGPLEIPAKFDPWGVSEAGGDGFDQPEGEIGTQEYNEQDPWGDFVKAEPLARSTVKQPDSSATELSISSATDKETFFLAPSTAISSEVKDPTGSLGVTAKTLLEAFSKHIVYREASGKLAFGMPSSGCVVDYHAYEDNGEEVNAYVCFINDKYSAGFSPKSKRVSELPQGKSYKLSYETIKLALEVCERQR